MSEKSEETVRTFYFPKNSILVSKNLHLFLLDYYRVIDMFFFTVHLAHRVDEAGLTASKALLPLARDDIERDKYQSVIDSPERAVKKLNEFSILNSKNLTVNVVDSFLWFISATIQSAMKKRPEMAKSGESVKVEEIFEFANRKDLINYLIDKKVNSLSYGGMLKIEKFILDTMGVEVFEDQSSRELMKIFVEIRNIQTHNRGIVNHLFLSRTTQHEKFGFSEGKRAQLDFDELVTFTRVCVEAAINLDENLCSKFGIERRRYSTWLKKPGVGPAPIN